MIRPRHPSRKRRTAKPTPGTDHWDFRFPGVHGRAEFRLVRQPEVLLKVVFAVEGAFFQVSFLACGVVVCFEVCGGGVGGAAEGADGAGGGFYCTA